MWLGLLVIIILSQSIASREVTKSSPNKIDASTLSYVIQDIIEVSSSSSQEHETETFEALQSEVPAGQPQPDVKWINTNELMELLSYLAQNHNKSPFTNAIIIDTRSSNEYNGWKSFDGAGSIVDFNQSGLLPIYDMKNGHITDAHNFDADWIHLFDPDLLNTLIRDRLGLKPRGQIISNPESDFSSTYPVILYDTSKIRLEKVKSYLIKNFQFNIVYLCQMDTKEMSDLILKSNVTGNFFFQEPFFDMLISADVLNIILRPYNDSYVIKVNPIADYKLFDVCQGGSEKHYERSHIPTAMHLDTNDLETNWIRKNKTDLARLFLSYGILPNNSEMIILYGNPDPLASFRAALIMKWMGIREVHVLNGGYRSWLIKNLPVETFPNKRISVKEDLEQNIHLFEEQSLYAQSPINYIVDRNYVSDIVKNHELFSEQYTIVDVRSYEEHVGETSGYTDLKHKGRIPSSLWGRGGVSSEQLEDYRNPDLTMRSGVEILKMWDEIGIDYKTKHLIFYCGNGWRSSEVMFYAELMGLYKVSMYDGGWYDWSSNPNNSIQLGPSKDNGSITFDNKYSTNINQAVNSVDDTGSSQSSASSTTLDQKTQIKVETTLSVNKDTSSIKDNTNQPISNTDPVSEKSRTTKATYPATETYSKNNFKVVTAGTSTGNTFKISTFFTTLFIIFTLTVNKIQ